jgi:hypothetical protein
MVFVSARRMGFQATGDGGSEPEPVQEHEGINADDDDMAGGDPSGSLGPPSPPPPTTAREMVVSPRSQASASTMALGKRRHRETIDADPQLDDAVLLREPNPVPVDMEVQPGLNGRRSRYASSSSEKLFRDLPPQQPRQIPEQIPGSSGPLIFLSLHVKEIDCCILLLNHDDIVPLCLVSW